VTIAMQRRLASLGLCLGLFFATAATADGSAAQRLVAAARQQIGVTTQYDGSYRPLRYPGGDVPLHTGVCTDVVIRAYRQLGADLQVLVHEDMKTGWSAYPRQWGLKQPDRNIDHRRVPNLTAFFRRQNAALPVSQKGSDYQPGDIVTWMLPGNLPHIGIVSDQVHAGRPLVVHNIGGGTREEDMLFAYPVTGHFRYTVPARLR
jgi:uncharacterized protein YijF (DUF1287 family)